MVYRSTEGRLRLGEIALVVYAIQSQVGDGSHNRAIIKIKTHLEAAQEIVEELLGIRGSDYEIHWEEYPQGEWWCHYHSEDGGVVVPPIMIERQLVE